jgi:hypothetical protein
MYGNELEFINNVWKISNKKLMNRRNFKPEMIKNSNFLHFQASFFMSTIKVLLQILKNDVKFVNYSCRVLNLLCKLKRSKKINAYRGVAERVLIAVLMFDTKVFN